jgi:D-alanyl-D-alanine carboxypeptidase/D-alanyl-D-alanine-endopeptidase (penicillin-binding protein 4)
VRQITASGRHQRRAGAATVTVVVGLAISLGFGGAVSCTGYAVDTASPATRPSAPGSSEAPPQPRPTVVISPPEAPRGPSIVVRPVRGPWADAIERAVGTADVSVAVGLGNRIVLVHRGRDERTLASTTKLLTSMTALDAFGPRHVFPTRALAASSSVDGTLPGDLWLVGAGDPELGRLRLDDLARAIHEAGVREIEGAVRGDMGAFDRGWWAPGWIPGVSRRYVRRTTALAFEGNAVAEPELAAAAALTAALRALGVTVHDEPSAGRAPTRLTELARIRSSPLADLLTRQNQGSLNFHAEALAKALGAERNDASTAGGAATTRGWASARGVQVEVRDGSGLSYDDRASAVELVTLLLLARSERWFDAFLASLARPGVGTLEGRLSGMDVYAKTGTLIEMPVSTLAGYVRTQTGGLAAFAILSDGFGKDAAVRIEDDVVHAIADAQLRSAVA